MNLCPGDVLALRYKVKRRIGGGSFGEIFIGKYLNSDNKGSFLHFNFADHQKCL